MRCLVVLAGLAALTACGDNAGPPQRVLVFTRTLGYRHADSIELGTQVLTERLAEDGIEVDATEDPAAFTPEGLAHYGAVAFLYTTGNDLLDPAGKLALEDFVRAGGGWLGLHSASDTEYEWPFYQQLLVVHFEGHPPIQSAIVDVEDREHPATRVLEPGRWPAMDEWYNFAANPRGNGVRVLATLDETTYSGGTMGVDHPVIWCHEELGGRVFYSELGHVAERWHEPAFVEHVAGAFRWTLRRE